MRRETLLSLITAVFLFSIVVQPVVADAQIEIIISDTEVFEYEEFSFDARFTNPDALAYDTFHLYSEGTEELNWGYHMFQGEDYTLYTERYTIGLGELGYYTIYVAVFAMFDSGIPRVTDSISIHVIEKAQVPTLDFGLIFLTILAATVGLFIVFKVRKHEPTPSAPPKVEPPKIDRPRYREPAPLVLVVCPYCGAKNEQGILKCRACGAEM